MARVIYLDCFSGAAGDMLLAALIDAGLPVEALRQALGSLGVDHDIEVTRVVRSGIGATHFKVRDKHHHHTTTITTIPATVTTTITTTTAITRWLKSTRSLRVQPFRREGRRARSSSSRRIGEAEAAIHETTLDQVHLHEVGALDSIIDIVGAVFALEWFGTDDIVASPLNVGSGTVQIAHGTFPVPAPATLRLLKGVPVYSSGLSSELVTPTGALLVSAYARSYGPMPPMSVDRIGYGAGTKDFDGVPNVLRVVVGERAGAHS